MSYDEELVKVIDQRVRLHQQRSVALGTCVGRDTVGPGAQVLFDGATVAVPVKVWGHVELQPGMRCGMQLYGTEWMVEGAFATPQMGYAQLYAFGPTTSNTVTSATYVDLNLAPFEFIKFHDATRIRYMITAAGFSTVSSTAMRVALRFTQVEGEGYTPTDNFQGPYVYWSSANLAMSQRNGITSTEVVPAGRYSVQLRWRRVIGTGTVTTSADNLFQAEVWEVTDPASPYV